MTGWVERCPAIGCRVEMRTSLERDPKRLSPRPIDVHYLLVHAASLGPVWKAIEDGTAFPNRRYAREAE